MQFQLLQSCAIKIFVLKKGVLPARGDVRSQYRSNPRFMSAQGSVASHTRAHNQKNKLVTTIICSLPKPANHRRGPIPCTRAARSRLSLFSLHASFPFDDSGSHESGVAGEEFAPRGEHHVQPKRQPEQPKDELLQPRVLALGRSCRQHEIPAKGIDQGHFPRPLELPQKPRTAASQSTCLNHGMSLLIGRHHLL